MCVLEGSRRKKAKTDDSDNLVTTMIEEVGYGDHQYRREVHDGDGSRSSTSSESSPHRDFHAIVQGDDDHMLQSVFQYLDNKTLSQCSMANRRFFAAARRCMDPRKSDGQVILWLGKKGYVDAIRWLLEDGRMNPTSSQLGLAIGMASEHGHLEVIRLLLEDDRADPSTEDSNAIRMASKNGHTAIVRLLLQDDRADPSAQRNHSIRIASKNGHTEVVHLLLQDDRVDPSAWNNSAIGMASKNGHTDIVRLLLQDDRVDPSAENNYALRMARKNSHADVIQLLLQDNRFDPSD